jgi:DNA topoisomerase IB
MEQSRQLAGLETLPKKALFTQQRAGKRSMQSETCSYATLTSQGALRMLLIKRLRTRGTALDELEEALNRQEEGFRRHPFGANTRSMQHTSDGPIG